jgi:hypothetical protein
MFGHRPQYTGVNVILHLCWRAHCKELVDSHDTLGLCPTHIEELRDPDFSRELNEYEKPYNADAQRSV